MRFVVCMVWWCGFVASAVAEDAGVLARSSYPAGYQTQCPGFDEFIATCRDPEIRWARRHLFSEALEVHFPVNYMRADGQAFVWADGDLRWVMSGLDDRTNLSKSENRGFNYGAFPFIHEGALHLLGGYGFWRNHADWITFMSEQGEWEINRVSGASPEGQPHHACWQEGSSVHWLGLDAQLNGDARATEWWVLDLSTKQWSQRGVLEFPMGQGWRTVFDLENYIVLLDGSNGYALVRKSDGHVAIVSADQWAVDLWRACTERGTMFNQGDVLGWISPAGETSTWNFATRADESTFLNYFAPFEPDAPESMSDPVWVVVPFLGLGGLALGWWWGRRGRREASGADRGSVGKAAVNSGVEHWSPALRALLLQPERELLTAELDALLGISDVQSPETLRARRARTISSVNAEFELLFGYTLIQRDRGSSDRRKVVYRLASPPSMVRKLLRDRGISAQRVSVPPREAPAESRP